MELGENAGRYRVHERIAAGGMGEVFRASMETVGGVEKPIALKVVKGSLAKNPDFAALFVEEAKVAMTLSHANVVQAFDVGRIDDRWFLAMEHVDGVHLGQLMKASQQRIGQRIPRRHAIFVIVEALKGLDYAHRRHGRHGEPLHIVHRDVSPGNILISREGEVKVADFGIAKSTMRSFGSMAGTIKGKIPYMAPEQLRGAAVDKRADIYSVGAVMYEVLTGRRIVEESDLSDALPRVLDGTYPAPRSIDPSVPEELDRIVKKALAGEPSDRYASAAAMRQDLEQLALEEKFLLSSNDLADFVIEVMERDEKRAERRPVLPSSGAPTTPARAVPEETPRVSENDPFDAILGMELEKVNSTEAFSVFTSNGGKRLSTLERPVATPAEPVASIAREPAAPTTQGVDTGTVPGFPSRKKKRNAALALGAALGVATVVALGSVAMDGDAGEAVDAANAPRMQQPAPSTELTTAAAPPRPEERPAEERPTAELPRGVDVPPAAGDEAHESEVTAMDERSQRTRRRERAPRRGTGATREVAMTATATAATAPPDPVPVQSAENGFLSVNTDPWSYVYLDDQRLGPTPQLRHALRPGRHRVRLHNPSEGLDRSIVIDVSPGEHERVTLDLR